MYKNMYDRNFYLSKDHKNAWDSREKFFIITTMHAELDLLTTMITLPTIFL